ncbi:hypothetical protein, partial [Bergeriella denitrificans]|uniref:hypothetical protein n=1 Tax=Bergeriella denitrificans TaxID=494 RepID=UPI001C3F8CE6
WLLPPPEKPFNCRNAPNASIVFSFQTACISEYLPAVPASAKCLQTDLAACPFVAGMNAPKLLPLLFKVNHICLFL